MLNLNIRFVLITLLSLTAIAVFTACPDNPPTHHRDSTIHLSVVKEGTFSVRLNVSVEDSSDVWTFRLNRDDSTVAVISSLRADTTVRDGGLLPGHTYRYRAYWLDGGEATDSSEEVTATTMDTTSHNFTWEIDTLGNYGSYLNDVAIVDENNIWAVGNIETDSATYNAAHWDGSEWELNRFLYNGIAYQGRAIFIIDNYILISSGTLFSWDGNNWEEWDIDIGTFPGGINAIWGSSPDDIYLVGDNGSIVHYDGSTFSRMESGTEAHFIDIGGLNDYIWAITYSNPPIINEVLHYDGITWSHKFDRITDNWPPEDYFRPSGTFRSVWVSGDTLYLSCASLWKESLTTGEGQLVPLETMHWGLGWGTGHVRGNGYNDLVVTTAIGSEVSHYNGKDWYFFDELKVRDANTLVSMSGLAMKDNLIVIVGEDNRLSKAVIYRGYR